MNYSSLLNIVVNFYMYFKLCKQCLNLEETCGGDHKCTNNIRYISAEFYSETCIIRPPLELEKGGLYSQVYCLHNKNKFVLKYAVLGSRWSFQTVVTQYRFHCIGHTVDSNDEQISSVGCLISNNLFIIAVLLFLLKS